MFWLLTHENQGRQCGEHDFNCAPAIYATSLFHYSISNYLTLINIMHESDSNSEIKEQLVTEGTVSFQILQNPTVKVECPSPSASELFISPPLFFLYSLLFFLLSFELGISLFLPLVWIRVCALFSMDLSASRVLWFLFHECLDRKLKVSTFVWFDFSD